MAVLNEIGTNLNTDNEAGMTWVRLLYGQMNINVGMAQRVAQGSQFDVVQLPSFEAKIAVSEGRAAYHNRDFGTVYVRDLATGVVNQATLITALAAVRGGTAAWASAADVPVPTSDLPAGGYIQPGDA